jgi:hypothetical protein
MAEGKKQRSQRGIGDKKTGGLRDRIRGTIRLRWVSPAHLRCLNKTSEKRTCVGLHKVVLLSTTWAVL